MRALTIRQPWAFAIAEGLKTTENRSRSTRHRGPLLIHAGQTFEGHVSIVRYSRDAAIRLDELGGRSNFWDARCFIPSKVVAPPPPSLALSAIIAVAEVTGCHREESGCCQPWGFPGAYHWQLADVRALPTPVPVPGSRGLWTPSDDVLAAVQQQLEEVSQR